MNVPCWRARGRPPWSRPRGPRRGRRSDQIVEHGTPRLPPARGRCSASRGSCRAGARRQDSRRSSRPSKSSTRMPDGETSSTLRGTDAAPARARRSVAEVSRPCGCRRATSRSTRAADLPEARRVVAVLQELRAVADEAERARTAGAPARALMRSDTTNTASTANSQARCCEQQHDRERRRTGADDHEVDDEPQCAREGMAGRGTASQTVTP